jgi:GntR family transcriptional regulator / MocR family aminotransferase
VLLERTNSAADLVVEIERGTGLALHRQIETAIRTAIHAGRLPRGAGLPATRALAGDLGVSRGVVVEAYAQLAAEGYLTSRPGSYTTVAAEPRDLAESPPEPPAAGWTVDFCPCRADGSLFPRAAWLRSLRRVLNRASDADFGYVSSRGAPPLHAALATYLNRVRGTAAQSQHIVVCNGYAQGIALVISVLARAGATRIAVEDPCADDDAVPAARAAGLEVIGVPVDADGIRVDSLAGIDADALVLTPSHQWPTGGVLSAPARRRVLEWARRHDALIVEDDYDAEYRYDRAPIGAMHGLAPDRVIYAGTASKTLAPGLRLGWLVVPPRLVAEVAQAKALADRGSPVLDQLAFADFLAAGEFDRHLRRMRPVYRRRRDALVAALGEHCPQLRPAGIAAGLHLIAHLPDGVCEDAVIAAAAARGVAVYGLGPYRLAPGGPGALLFGYATLDEPELERGVCGVAEALAAVQS